MRVIFGIGTKSYDQEPQRNVAATAKRVSHAALVASSSSRAIPSVSNYLSWSTETGTQQLQCGVKAFKRGSRDPSSV
ncbi:unnamed protein product [Gongylonema pulchrum]|uniref:Uncharacterized protein n=1 Tax=Gongylonema pulchrum TaxID=637853 RepID=A0A183D0U6_9BILA|nr:unnamed protein product [Gongylonema pulchrum]